MKKFLMAMVALSFALAAAMTGCGRSEGYCEDPNLCEPTEGVILKEIAPPTLGESAGRDTDGDLITFDGAPDPVDDTDDDETPVAGMPMTDKYASVVADSGADFSEENLEQKIKAFEESSKDEPGIIQEIIDVGYGHVPSVVADPVEVRLDAAKAEAEEFEIDPAEAVASIAGEASEEADIAADLVTPDEGGTPEAALGMETADKEEMVADYEKYLDIEAYEAEKPAEIVIEPPAAETAGSAKEGENLPEFDDFVKDPESMPIPVSRTPEEPVAEPEQVAAQEPVQESTPEPVKEQAAAGPLDLPAPAEGKEELGQAAVVPPPVYDASAPAPEPAVAVTAPAEEPADELSLEEFDDADLEFFGNISESLLEAGGEG